MKTNKETDNFDGSLDFREFKDLVRIIRTLRESRKGRRHFSFFLIFIIYKKWRDGDGDTEQSKGNFGI